MDISVPVSRTRALARLAAVDRQAPGAPVEVHAAVSGSSVADVFESGRRIARRARPGAAGEIVVHTLAPLV